MPPLICFDCHIRRNKMASPVFTKPTKKEMIEGAVPYIIGWCCIKCFKKRKVAERPKGVGWRVAFRDLIHAVIKKGKGKI